MSPILSQLLRQRGNHPIDQPPLAIPRFRTTKRRERTGEYVFQKLRDRCVSVFRVNRSNGVQARIGQPFQVLLEGQRQQLLV